LQYNKLESPYCRRMARGSEQSIMNRKYQRIATLNARSILKVANPKKTSLAITFDPKC
jgi:hypothetical protein